MSDYSNNAFFWQKLDTLFLSSGVKVTRKKGDIHPVFPNLIYPTDYGQMKDTNASFGHGVSVYCGSQNRNQITGLVVAVDILAKELDVKVLAGCSEEEVDNVLRFLNQTDYQKTVMIRRGKEIPAWGYTEN
ncbi:MAG: Inorganic pyrophosphatase [Solobacterium sp.]|nr:Inorganic pyrophosphatase [Solobacterium sp.]